MHRLPLLLSRDSRPVVHSYGAYILRNADLPGKPNSSVFSQQ